MKLLRSRSLREASAKPQDQMKRRFLLDIVIGERSAVLKLFPGKNQPLLVRGDAFFVLDLLFDVFDGVAGLDFERDGFSGEGLDENLHRRFA